MRRLLHSLIVLAVAVGGTIWVVTLAEDLPGIYSAQRWAQAWIVFDIGILGSLIMVTTLHYFGSLWYIAWAFVSGTLLLCDAWFDCMTAGQGDLPFSLVLLIPELLTACGLIYLGVRGLARLAAEGATFRMAGPR